jgi:serine/threonine-protein kinase SRPK3
LKTLKADASESNQGVDTHLHLSASDIDHQGIGHVLELLDHFRHDGANGTHLCLVFPAMVSDGKDMVLTARPHDAAYVRTISKQLLLGLISSIRQASLTAVGRRLVGIGNSVAL